MKFSIIIPLYNKEHFIKDCINSVIAQSFFNWEAIIINDGSTDSSAQIVQSFQDHRIRFYSQPNQGVSRTRNRAISLADGEYITFLDADDKWKPTYLETMNNLTVKYPNFNVFCSAQEGRLIRTLPDGVSIIYDHCAYAYVFWTGCMLVKKDIFHQIGGFREGVQLGEDRDMWLRIACNYPCVFLNEELAYHPYITENNLTRTIDTVKSFPYWEWYNYPYPYKRSLYRYTTDQIVRCTEDLIRQKRFQDAWFFLQKTKGCTSIFPRMKQLLTILFNL